MLLSLWPPAHRSPLKVAACGRRVAPGTRDAIRAGATQNPFYRTAWRYAIDVPVVLFQGDVTAVSNSYNDAALFS
jgi:hypothetical protein